MKTVIFYPNNSTSLILGRNLLKEDHEIFLYMPKEVHKQMAHTIPQELEIVGMNMACKSYTLENLERLKEMDFLIFPTLDVLPMKKREDFVKMLRDLFR